MLRYNKVHGWACVALITGVVAAVGCGGKSTGTTTGAPGGTGGTGAGTTSSAGSGAGTTSSAASTGTGGTGTASSAATTTSSGTGGSGPGACTAYLLELCTQMKACTPHLYAQVYENDDALCQSEAVRLCSELPTGLDDTSVGFNDPAACTTAVAGTCTAFLQSQTAGGPQNPAPLAACQPKPGTKTIDQGCAATAQCGAGLYCYPGGQQSCMEYCGPVGTAGRPCGTSFGTKGTPQDFFCDPASNLHCVIGTTGTNSDSALVCRLVTYGAAGAACTPGSDKECDSGFTCSKSGTTKNTCIAQLTETSPCDATTTDKDPCDTRLGIQCLANKAPATGSSCQVPTTYVPMGASCGGTTNQTCSDYAFCNTNNQCERKAMLNAGCVTGGCFPPYVCTAGTCQAPPVTVDPTCTPEPITDNACGLTPGGLPTVCTNAPCCRDPGGTIACGTGPTTCGFTSPDDPQTELDCEDSSQCAPGSLCCLGFNTAAYPFVKGSCVASAQCKGFEVCRTESTTPCTGSGGTCTGIGKITTHDWSTALGITDIGFCQVPTCAPLLDPCTVGTDCCSGSCEPGYNTCN